VAWEVIGDATRRQYTPVEADAGCTLRVTCTPARADASEPAAVLRGEPAAAECGPVAVPPSPAAGEGRHRLTQEYTTAPDLRVVTYNILADQYAATETARDVLFAQCPPE
jgi:2',5'-phosphodiesterase